MRKPIRKRPQPTYRLARSAGETTAAPLGNASDESEPEFILAPPHYALLDEEGREYVDELLEVLVDTALRHQREREMGEQEKSE